MTNFPNSAAVLTLIEPVLIDSVTEAVSQTIAMFAGEPKVIKADEAIRVCDGICGTISFVGDRNFSVMMCCSRESALELSLAMAGFEIDFESADMGDAIGEVVNIIAGDIVARMEGHGVEVAMSLPTVFRGHDVERVLPHNMISNCTIFELANSSFWIDVIAGQPMHTRPVPEVCPVCGR